MPFIIVIDTALMSATLVGTRLSPAFSLPPTLQALDSPLLTPYIPLPVTLSPAPFRATATGTLFCSVIATLLLINELLTRA